MFDLFMWLLAGSLNNLKFTRPIMRKTFRDFCEETKPDSAVLGH